LLSLVRSTRALQDCSDRVLAEADTAANQPVAQTSLCQLEDVLRLAIRWTMSWLAAEPLTAGLGGGDAGLDALADKVPLGWEHIGLTGDYVWSTADQPSAGTLRALRQRQSLVAA
jgi:hypothetical protein